MTVYLAYLAVLIFALIYFCEDRTKFEALHTTCIPVLFFLTELRHMIYNVNQSWNMHKTLRKHIFNTQKILLWNVLVQKVGKDPVIFLTFTYLLSYSYLGCLTFIYIRAYMINIYCLYGDVSVQPVLSTLCIASYRLSMLVASIGKLHVLSSKLILSEYVRPRTLNSCILCFGECARFTTHHILHRVIKSIDGEPSS